MPEDESLNALLRKGDPAGTLSDTARSSQERYEQLLPRLLESEVPVVPSRDWRHIWLAAPTLALAVLAYAALLWRPSDPIAPVATAAPSVERIGQGKLPTPHPTAKPTPALPIKRDTLAQKDTKPQLRSPQRRYRKRVRVASAQYSRRKYRERVRRHIRPVEPVPASVERIVIESVQPPPPVAIAIVGEGENLSVTPTFPEEKS